MSQSSAAPKDASPAGDKPNAPAPLFPPDAVRAEVDKIVASAGFVRSERLSRFLRFAVEKKLQNQADQLKEYLLGIEVFDKGSSFDPRLDPIVRVEAARLRTKLREYYGEDGRDDAIRIGFSKGSYAPTLDARAPSGGAVQPASARRIDWMLVASLVALAGALVWGLALRIDNAKLRRAASPAREPLAAEFLAFWSGFFSGAAPTYAVFGSPMFFSSDSLNLFLRRPNLNDASAFAGDPAFRALEERFGPLAGPRYDYAEMGDALALQRLTTFFGRGGTSLSALPAHQATWDFLKGGNIVFLGTSRMNALLRRLPVQKDFEWGPDDNLHNLRPQPGEQNVYSTTSNRDAVTYAVIAHLPGLEPGRQILLLMSHSSPGALAAVDYLTREETMRATRQRLGLEPNRPHYFQMLLRVLVDDNIPVKTEYVTHHDVDPAAPAPSSR